MKQIALAVLFLCLPVEALAAPAVEIQDNEIVLREVTPGGGVALLGVGRRWQGAVTVRSLDVEHLVDHDGDGVVRYEPGMPVGDRAVFVAVDIASGAHGVAIRGGVSAKASHPLEATMLRSPAGDIDRLRLPGEFAYALMVRPGEGAWWTGISDGNSADQDGASDGSFTLAPVWAEVLEGGRPAPLSFDASDLVVLIQPKALTWSITSLDAPTVGLEDEVTR